MNNKIHSRKISLLVAVLVLLAGIFIGGYLVLKSNRGLAGQLDEILSGKSLNSQICQPNADDAQKDSDTDGLKDWQEIQIYKTDPCKQDTDGDGYLDGEEAASGYDPLKKAPGDELAGTVSKTPRPLPENLTEALRQSLLGQIKSNQIQPFNTSGGLLSSEEIQNYPGLQQSINEIVANSSQLFAPDPIDESQIKISKDSSPQAIQHYAAAVGAALPCCEKKENSSESEEELFLKAIEDNDFSDLNTYLAAYKKSYEELKKITTPSDLLPLHQEQLEIFSSLIKVYEAIKEINSDPLKANLALQEYASLSEQLDNWALRLADFINQHQ